MIAVMLWSRMFKFSAKDLSAYLATSVVMFEGMISCETFPLCLEEFALLGLILLRKMYQVLVCFVFPFPSVLFSYIEFSILH
jgi:hypothetical protein